MDTQTLEQNLTEFFQNLTVKKTKSTGKLHFFDQDEYLVFDITTKSQLGFTHRSYFPELKHLSEKEAEAIVLKVVKNLGFDVNAVAFLDYPSEKEQFGGIGDPHIKSATFNIYKAFKNRDALVPYLKK
jgi:hypothetical protein